MIKKWCKLKRSVYIKSCKTRTVCRRKWNIGGIILTRQKYCRKTCPRATLCTTNPIWTGLGLNPILHINRLVINPLNPELNPICYLLALLGAHYFLHVSRIRVKSLTFRLLMLYIYGAPILDVSRSHTTTQHSR